MSRLTLVTNQEEKRHYHYETVSEHGIYCMSRYYIRESNVCVRDVSFCLVSDKVKDSYKLVKSHKPKKYYFSKLLRYSEGRDSELPLELMLLLEHCCHDDVSNLVDLRLGELSSNKDFDRSAASLIVECIRNTGVLLYVPSKWFDGFERRLSYIMLHVKNETGESYG